MNIKRKHFLALSLAGVGAISAFSSVSAASLDAGTSTKVCDQVHTAIKQAFTTDDYQAYLLATKDNPSKLPTLTESQFHVMVQAQKLRQAGDITGAKKLLDDAGIKPPMHTRNGKHGDREEKMANLTDAQKATLKEAKALFEAGKQTEAKALLGTAGISLPMREGHSNSTLKSIKHWFTKSPKTATTTTQ